MSMLNAPGWIHEHDQSGEPSGTPEGALMAWLRYGRGGCDDNTDDREIDALDDATHVVSLMELRTRPSSTNYAHWVRWSYGVNRHRLSIDWPRIEQSGDESAGVLRISYVRKVKT